MLRLSVLWRVDHQMQRFPRLGRPFRLFIEKRMYKTDPLPFMEIQMCSRLLVWPYHSSKQSTWYSLALIRLYITSTYGYEYTVVCICEIVSWVVFYSLIKITTYHSNNAIDKNITGGIHPSESQMYTMDTITWPFSNNPRFCGKQCI